MILSTKRHYVWYTNDIQKVRIENGSIIRWNRMLDDSRESAQKEQRGMVLENYPHYLLVELLTEDGKPMWKECLLKSDILIGKIKVQGYEHGIEPTWD